MGISESELKAAHARSIRHRAEVERSGDCGCFHCLAIFEPRSINAWTDQENGTGQTALCPECGIDSVIGGASGLPVSESFLRSMRSHWFDEDP
jgi:hypothetical protein